MDLLLGDMMSNFAIYQDNVIVNVIVADSKEIAEQVTGMNAIETNGSPWIGWTKQGDTWVAPVIEEPALEELEPTE